VRAAIKMVSGIIISSPISNGAQKKIMGKIRFFTATLFGGAGT
jgi:hypothetical protein